MRSVSAPIVSQLLFMEHNPHPFHHRMQTMILEHVDIRIDPAQAPAFEVAIERGVTTVIAQATGFRGYKVNRSQESAGRYILMIYWDSVEDHMVGFRQSDAFTQWRAIVGPFFTQPPVMEHLELVCKSI